MPPSDRYVVFILDGSTAYNSIAAFNNELERVIRSTGLDVVRLDIDDPHKFNDALRAAMAQYPERIAAAFSFSGFGVELGDTTGNGNLWQRLKIPMLSIMLDHPCYFLARHKTPTAAVMRIYPNRDFLDFHETYIRSPFRTVYCPFGAMTYGREPLRRLVRSGETPLIILPKSGSNPRLLEEPWTLLPRLMQKIIRDSIDHYWGETARSGPVSNSVLVAADAAGLELRNDVTLFTFFITQLDDYVRKNKVDILIKNLLPLPVKIYGSGIDYLEMSGARAEILPPVAYEKLIDLFYSSLAIISMNPNIDDECHDRPYSALGTGALPISDINPWWEKTFPDLLPYSYDFKEKPVSRAVENLLADPQRASDVAWEASLRQCRTRTFDHMVVDVLELALVQRYFTFNFKPPQPYFAKCPE